MLGEGYHKIERISLYKDMNVYFGATEGLDEDNDSIFEADIDFMNDGEVIDFLNNENLTPNLRQGKNN